MLICHSNENIRNEMLLLKKIPKLFNEFYEIINKIVAVSGQNSFTIYYKMNENPLKPNYIIDQTSYDKCLKDLKQKKFEKVFYHPDNDTDTSIIEASYKLLIASEKAKLIKNNSQENEKNIIDQSYMIIENEEKKIQNDENINKKNNIKNAEKTQENLKNKMDFVNEKRKVDAKEKSIIKKNDKTSKVIKEENIKNKEELKESLQNDNLKKIKENSEISKKITNQKDLEKSSNSKKLPQINIVYMEDHRNEQNSNIEKNININSQNKENKFLIETSINNDKKPEKLKLQEKSQYLFSDTEKVESIYSETDKSEDSQEGKILSQNIIQEQELKPPVTWNIKKNSESSSNDSKKSSESSEASNPLTDEESKIMVDPYGIAKEFNANNKYSAEKKSPSKPEEKIQYPGLSDVIKKYPILENGYEDELTLKPEKVVSEIFEINYNQEKVNADNNFNSISEVNEVE